MNKLTKSIGIAVIALSLAAGATGPVLAAEGDHRQDLSAGERAAVRNDVREAVKEVLIEAGMDPSRIAEDRRDRLARRLGVLIDAGVIDQDKVNELVELRRAGELRKTLLERARETRRERRAIIDAYLAEAGVSIGDGELKKAIEAGLISREELNKRLAEAGIPIRWTPVSKRRAEERVEDAKRRFAAEREAREERAKRAAAAKAEAERERDQKRDEDRKRDEDPPSGG